jgi:hypothetical protein
MSDPQDSTFERLNTVGNSIHILQLIKYMASDTIFYPREINKVI